jgi:cytidylate kinase
MDELINRSDSENGNRMSIITLSHSAFDGGRALAEKVASILDYRCVSREVLIEASRRYGIPEAKLFEVLEKEPRHAWVRRRKNLSVYRAALQATLCELAQEADLVYHGRAGEELFSGIRHALNVIIDTPFEFRVHQLKAHADVCGEAAEKHLAKLDNIRDRRMKALFNIDLRDHARYDLIIDTSRMALGEAARLIAVTAGGDRYRSTPESEETLRDLTISARVAAVLLASPGPRMLNLKVHAERGEVEVSGIVMSGSSAHTIARKIEKVPGVNKVTTRFRGIPSGHTYLYAGLAHSSTHNLPLSL